ncbi:hypothetical protein FOV72_19660 [Gordonia rubripertincta]|uniref:hypothetical protein n=1 Tax=Gordonia rubripertincta TaxID=36822 RepID=UPI00117D1386|nr:hypothetical protein [Gordonia rubripertincta]TSD93479.1 hypothetical protein FOV72_19660 [Gordonia rubripertincta]
MPIVVARQRIRCGGFDARRTGLPPAGGAGTWWVWSPAPRVSGVVAAAVVAVGEVVAVLSAAAVGEFEGLVE